MKIVSDNGNTRGFSLLELMIVVSIVAIIAAIGVPTYREQIIKTSRSDAKAVLQGFSQAMERHFAQNNSYGGAAVAGADTGVPAIYSAKAPIDGDAKYDLTIEQANAATFRLRATPRAGGTQVNDGFLEITNTGRRGWNHNGDNDTDDAGEDSWEQH